MQEAETVPVTDDATETPTPGVSTLADYPESDGKPMAETPWHMQAMADAISSLKEFFRDRSDVYVGGNMMMYYVENDTRTSVSADVFVTFGVPKLPERGVWRTWVEGGKLADFVLEVTSHSTRRQDETRKKELYEKLGVREYWQFDPDGDYLDPRLKGRRLGPDGVYRPVVLEEREGAEGALCHASLLGLELRLEAARLRLFNPLRGGYLLTFEEKMEALAAAEAARDREALARRTAEDARDQEARARRTAEVAARAAEARIAELERRLAETGD